MNAKLLLGALAFMLFGQQTTKRRRRKRTSFKKRYYRLMRRRRFKRYRRTAFRRLGTYIDTDGSTDITAMPTVVSDHIDTKIK